MRIEESHFGQSRMEKYFIVQPIYRLKKKKLLFDAVWTLSANRLTFGRENLRVKKTKQSGQCR